MLGRAKTHFCPHSIFSAGAAAEVDVDVSQFFSAAKQTSARSNTASTGATPRSLLCLTAVQFIISENIVSNIAADTSKAFASVEHGRLLEKLGWYGMDDHWFYDWLHGRNQIVKGGSQHGERPCFARGDPGQYFGAGVV